VNRRFLAACWLALALLPAGGMADEPAGDGLSHKPPRSPGETSLATSPSTIGLGLTLPYGVIAGAATNAIPVTYDGEDQRPACANLEKVAKDKVGGNLGKWLGKVAKSASRLAPHNDQGQSCLEVDTVYTVHRDGPVTVGSGGDHLRLSVPLSVAGQAGFSGDLARALHLDHKNFRGSLTATADIRLAIGSDWCPKLNVQPGYAWRDKARIEIVHGTWVDIDRIAGPKVQELMRSAAKKLERSVKCADVRRLATKAWHPYDLPLHLPADTTLQVTATPLSIGLSAIRYAPNGIAVSAGIEAKIEAATAPPPPATAAALPPLRPTAPGAGQVDLLVPVRIDYATLQAMLADRLAKHPITGDIAAGHLSIAVNAVEIYPSGGRLAVGLGFAATTPESAMNATGWLYLVGSPALDAATQTLRVEDLSFTPQIDNKLWSVLTAAFSKQILTAIQSQLVVDLKDRIDPVSERLQGALHDLAAKEGVDLALRDVAVEIRQIVPADQALEVLVGIHGTIAATIDTAVALPRL
jgi:hypothetical protein